MIAGKEIRKSKGEEKEHAKKEAKLVSVMTEKERQMRAQAQTMEAQGRLVQEQQNKLMALEREKHVLLQQQTKESLALRAQVDRIKLEQEARFKAEFLNKDAVIA